MYEIGKVNLNCFQELLKYVSISGHWDGTDSWNISCLFYIVSTMAADVLVTQVMVLTKFFQNIA